MHCKLARRGSDPTSPAICSTVSIRSDSADMVTIHLPCEISRGTEESTCCCCCCSRLCRVGQHPRLHSSNYRHLLHRHSQNLFSRRDLCNPKRRQRGRRRAHRPILPSSCFTEQKSCKNEQINEQMSKWFPTPFLPSFRCCVRVHSVTRKHQCFFAIIVIISLISPVLPHHDSISLSHRCPFVGPTAPSHGVPNAGDHPILSREHRGAL